MDNKLDRIGSMTGAYVRSPGETDLSYGQYLESALRNYGETRLRFWARVHAELKAADDRIKEMETLANQVNAKHEDYDPKTVTIKLNGETFKGMDIDWKFPKLPFVSEDTLGPIEYAMKHAREFGMTVDMEKVNDIEVRTKSEIWSDELRRKLKERAAAPENNLTMCFGYEGDDY